ncbi:MAG: twin-arginine translocase TatA/TatE family subunit [Desulfocapsaceae bacterium]|nr:twin-arginine translocase TatA/TatE family subunit [Desulfocapsaceae bacterium]
MFSGLFQPMHLILILIVVLIIFGPGKLPEIGEGLAKSIKSFKKNMKDVTEDKTDSVDAAPIEQKKEEPQKTVNKEV